MGIGIIRLRDRKGRREQGAKGRAHRAESMGHRAEVGGQEKRLPIAKELGETSLMFMVHPTLTEENMHYVVAQVKEVMAHAPVK